MNSDLKWTIGIDEAGRGPVAGPVAVGLFAVAGELPEDLRLTKDSKKLSAKKRQEWVEKIKAGKSEGLDIQFAYSLVSSDTIDNRGITQAIKIGIKKCLEKIEHEPAQTRVILDGGLRAPTEYQNQETIIGGDASESLIALASVVAKVARDNYMTKIADDYPAYGFKQHKGYGTAYHMAKIKECGMCEIHRRSFLKKVDL